MSDRKIYILLWIVGFGCLIGLSCISCSPRIFRFYAHEAAIAEKAIEEDMDDCPGCRAMHNDNVNPSNPTQYKSDINSCQQKADTKFSQKPRRGDFGP